MKRWCWLLLLFALTGCPLDEKQLEPVKPMCFDIVNVTNAPPALQPILINKCTGDTYIALQTSLPLRKDQLTPDKIWSWYKVEIGYGINAVGGLEKTPKY